MASPPFAGHLHPILGLARALAVHHEVRVLSTAAAMPIVQAAGLRGVTLLEGWDDRLRAVIDTPKAVGSNPRRLIRQLSQALELQLKVHEEVTALYRTGAPELLIADFALTSAGTAAELCGVSWWTSLPSPCVLEGGDGPPGYLGGLLPMDGLLGVLRNRAGWSAIRLFKRTTAAFFRRRLCALGITSLYRMDGSEAAYSHERILAFGSRDLEFRSDWPPYVRFMPLPLYTPPNDAPPPPFALGKRHVLVTLGTHLKFAKNEIAGLIRRVAAQLPDCEFHFSDGAGESAPVVTERNFTRLPFVDYQRFLGRYVLIVHHGGAGVMHHTLAAGLPAVVYPIDYDQFDHAARLHQAGLARWVRRPSDLAPAIINSLNDAGLARRCAAYAKMKREDFSAAVLKEIQRARYKERPGAAPLRREQP
ncbi:MAG TPA: glycosyltransferase [Steroidobacteraceae bacterium]